MLTKTQIDAAVKEYLSEEYPGIEIKHILYSFERPYSTLEGDVIDENEADHIYHLSELDTVIVPYTFVKDLKKGSYKFYFIETVSKVNYEGLDLDYDEAIPVEPFEKEGYVLNEIPLDVNLIIGERKYNSYKTTTDTFIYSVYSLPVLVDIEKVLNDLSRFEELLETETMKLVELTYNPYVHYREDIYAPDYFDWWDEDFKKSEINKEGGNEMPNYSNYSDYGYTEVPGKEAYQLLKKAHKAGIEVQYRDKYYATEPSKIYEVNGRLYVVGVKRSKEVKKLDKIEVENIILRHYKLNYLEGLKKKNSYSTSSSYSSYYRAEQHDITDIKVNDRLAILMIKREWLPYLQNVGSNEYQFMYSALTFEYAGGRLIVSIPIHIFSFPQEISGAHIDYQLKDISEQREKLLNLEQQKLDEAIKAYDEFIKLGAEKVKLTGLHSMHRHPGRFSFSGTDRSKNVNDVGVIYRNLYAEDAIQHDSVIVVEGNGFVDIHTTETYIVNVKPESEEEVEKAQREGRNIKVKGTYTELPTVTYIIESDKQADPLLDILGKHLIKNPIEGISYVGDENYALRETPVELAKLFKGIDFQPGVHVDPEHYKDRFSGYASYATRTISSSYNPRPYNPYKWW